MYRNGHGKPRRLALTNGTITVERPRVRNLDARSARRGLPLVTRRSKARGLGAPQLTVADGHLGLWGALAQGWPESAEHRCWNHKLRTVVESPFAAVRLRTSAAKRCKRVEHATARIWRLLLVAEQHVRTLNAPHLCVELYAGVAYADGQRVVTTKSNTAPTHPEQVAA